MSFKNPTFYSLEKLVAHARENASFYRSFYSNAPHECSLVELPIIDQEEYWKAHADDRMSVLAAPLRNGIVLNSGGTTGAPKYSYFDDQDWDSVIALSARTYEAAGLQDGDRVANLFAGGNLYASFIFATESMKSTRPAVLQLPLGFSPNLAPAAAIIHEFKANVLAGFPTHLLRLIEHMEQEKMSGICLDRIIYGGELFTGDQRAYLQERFPGIQVCSAGYASVDAGLIGYADADCAAGEHRVFDGAMVLEIIDEGTGEPIEVTGQPGRLVFTSLIRRLMPLIRYPTGDRGQWIEAQGSTDRKFQLLGRSEESARIAHYSVSFSEAASLLAPWQEALGLEQLQLLIEREDRLDRLTFRVVVDVEASNLEGVAEQILKDFSTKRVDIYETVKGGRLHPPCVDWIEREQLDTNPRTGKVLRIVDKRKG